MSAKQKRPVPVYIPTKKITVLAPKAMSKLAFQLNYKSLRTTRLEIDGDVCLVQFAVFESFRRCLKRWQLGETANERAIWEFFKDNVTLELEMIDVDPHETTTRQNQPYVPIIRFHIELLDRLSELFHAVKFR